MTDRSKYWETDARLDAFIENQQARSKHVTEKQPDELTTLRAWSVEANESLKHQAKELTALRKLASERLDRVTELAAENGELKHQLNGVVQELMEAQNGYNDHVALSRRLTAELATSREATRRAERDWTKALAERDEARALAERRFQDVDEIGREFANAQQTYARNREQHKAELTTTRAALREAHRVMSDHESMDLDAEMDAAVAMIERALNEVSK